MGTKRDRREAKAQEKQYQQEADVQIQNIKPTAFEDYYNKRNLALLQDLDSGKDVKDISGLSAYYNLYNNAAKDQPEMAGEGLLSNNQLAGGNGQLAGLIGKQLQSRRQQDASGALYNAVQGARGEAVAGGQWGAQMDNTRNIAKSGILNDRYNSFANRRKQPGFWERLLTGGIQAGAQIGAAAL